MKTKEISYRGKPSFLDSPQYAQNVGRLFAFDEKRIGTVRSVFNGLIQDALATSLVSMSTYKFSLVRF